MIDELHEYGLSVSSSRIMEVTSDLCHLVVERAQEEKILCPANLKRGLFTIAAFDNIDHTPRSTTSEGSFNGTGMSIFQLPTQGNPGEERTFSTCYSDVKKSGRRSVPHLPPSYALVPNYVPNNKQPPVPSCSRETSMHMHSLVDVSMQWKNEDAWLAHVREQISLDQNVGQMLNKSWSGFHATRVCEDVRTTCINSLLPLFHEHSATMPMVRHEMDITRQITAHVNDSQTSVMCVDQPLFALCKIAQWNWPELYGEDKFVVLFAPFHIEQTFLRVIGQFMQDCGWIGIAVNSGIITKGSAEAIMKVTHVTKARAMHQVTAAVLYDLMHGAFEIDDSNGEKSFEKWISETSASSPTVMFWLTVLNLEVLLLTFVRAIRLGNYALFKESIKRMMPWFFAFDHVNYSRWLAVHLKDLEELEKKAPDVHREFCSGNFVIRQTSRPFSALAVDQAHEQNNAKVKGSGGAIGLTQDAESLRRWMIAGPEVTRLLSEFQGIVSDIEFDTHHEQYPAFQNKFIERCAALKESFLQLGDPFKEHSTDLISLDSRGIAAPEAVQALYRAEQAGTDMYQLFVQERLITDAKSLYHPIRKLNIKIFSLKSKPSKTPAVKTLTTDVSLFSRLFIVSRERDLDLDLFFQFENQKCPPSLSQNGQIRSGKKADLAEKLESLTCSSTAPVRYDGLIYDGAALVHAVRPSTAKTFKQYFSQDFKSYILKQIAVTNAERVDVVWDLYLPNSLKNAERESRGAGTRRQVLPDAKLPNDWSDFLRNTGNKAELFQYLSRCLLDELTTVTVVTNIGNQIASSVDDASSLSGTSCCSMEEADGRIIMHAQDMVKHGAKRVLIKCSDTDVLVLCISVFSTLRSNGLQELWLLSGMGNKSRYVAVHNIAAALGDEKAGALPGFHAFTGCDTVSFFSSKSKKTAWKTWISYPAATAAFMFISKPQSNLDDDVYQILERFTALLYDSQTESSSVDQTRKDLFATKNKLLPHLPPTRAALHQHILRAAYQAGQIWGNSLMKSCDIVLPSPSAWGWKQNNETWVPVWSHLPEIWKELSFLEKCGCKKNCESQRCSCRRVGLPCTLQCTTCKGGCNNRSSTPIDESDEEL